MLQTTLSYSVRIHLFGIFQKGSESKVTEFEQYFLWTDLFSLALTILDCLYLHRFHAKLTAGFFCSYVNVVTLSQVIVLAGTNQAVRRGILCFYYENIFIFVVFAANGQKPVFSELTTALTVCSEREHKLRRRSKKVETLIITNILIFFF